ncbi:hypothetical protein Q3C01_02830 [Bradyrhizobium sp. UFLA05-109]
MTASSNHDAAAITSGDRPQTTEFPRIKFSKRGFAIDHPDLEAGERLMADAFGVADSDAMYGILKQLVKASVNGSKLDHANLAFMISMMQGIKPRDAIEAMLAAQMVCVHVTAMRSAHHLASAVDIQCQDSAARALGKLVRTFPAQIEALNRYRNKSEPAITVQNLSVQHGGKAIVGNVTQHARMIVAQPSEVAALADARTVPMPIVGEREPVNASQDASA